MFVMYLSPQNTHLIYAVWWTKRPAHPKFSLKMIRNETFLTVKIYFSMILQLRLKKNIRGGCGYFDLFRPNVGGLLSKEILFLNIHNQSRVVHYNLVSRFHGE